MGNDINKSDLIKMVATRLNRDKTSAEALVNGFVKIVQRELAKGPVQLGEFGTFRTGKRGPRKGRDPRTGKPIDLNECKFPSFKPGKQLLKALNERKKMEHK